MICIGYKIKDGFEFIIDKFLAFFIKKAMGRCGQNVMIKPTTSVFKGIENFYFSDNIRIARYAVIYSTLAKVYIGEKVDIAPYLKIMTGNHRFDKVGHFMFDGDYEKRPENDKDVIIESDSWLGINVTLLSGITIGRGSVIAAGAIVNKSCPPYSVIGGVPAKVLKFRFTIDEILEHEKKLYSSDNRLTRKELAFSREKYIIHNNKELDTEIN
ncbi:DapH/DapD/GlmU-related protein [uncultured Draconibacterium sp.]|uniref:acyltransferase n=1 Tax=uncultured Draconibacterium sp. TaxID=1573823 RepID=UPI002AA94DC1|nr:DapH/DapD/GlmU-related protein [uncultured Draconibacterium sp.]